MMTLVMGYLGYAQDSERTCMHTICILSGNDVSQIHVICSLTDTYASIGINTVNMTCTKVNVYL